MSLTTIYRAIVMIAVGVIVVKAWQLYGPSNEKVKSFSVQAVEVAQSTWSNWQHGSAKTSPQAVDPRAMMPLAVGVEPTTATDPAPPALVAGTTTLSAEASVPGTEIAAPPIAKESASVSAELGNAPPLEAGVADSLSPLFARLEELGVGAPQLAPWGASGQLYRCCCRAKLSDTVGFARHFEAVAAEPRAAVEQVVAQVEAWRMVQRDETALR